MTMGQQIIVTLPESFTEDDAALLAIVLQGDAVYEWLVKQGRREEAAYYHDQADIRFQCVSHLTETE